MACKRLTWQTGREILFTDIIQETASKLFGFGRYLLYLFEINHLKKMFSHKK